MCRNPRILALSLVALLLTGCGGDDDKDKDKDKDKQPTVEMIRSNRPRVRFRGGRRYATDLAEALKLERKELCTELGKFDCVDFVHRISLGGVEPYELGIREPLEQASVTTPIAVDRVALSACGTRAAKDFDDPGGALLFGPLSGGAGGEMARTTVAKSLYDRLLRRDATDDEVAALVGFWPEVTSEMGETASAAQQYATLICFAVATSEEALFY